MKIKVKCEWCGKVFKKYRSTIKKHIFHSVKCRWLWYTQNHKKKVKCFNCEKIIEKNLSETKSKRIFCNKECHYNTGRKTIKCDGCGILFLSKLNRVKEHKSHFHSKECLQKNRFKLAKTWRKERISLICTFCGDSRDIPITRLYRHNPSKYRCEKCMNILKSIPLKIRKNAMQSFKKITNSNWFDCSASVRKAFLGYQIAKEEVKKYGF